MKRYLLVVPAGLLAAALLSACGDGPDPEPTPTAAATSAPTQPRVVATPTLAPGTPVVLENATTTPSGLKYVDTVVGTGAAPTAASPVTINYKGMFAANGQVFDSTEGKQPYPAPRADGFIKGFTEALLSMKEGGKRTVYIPSALGYGPSGYPPIIPGNADLVFEIELVKVGQ